MTDERKQSRQMSLKDYMYLAKVKETTRANVYSIIEASERCDIDLVVKAAGFETGSELAVYLNRWSRKHLGFSAPCKIND